MAGLSRAGLLVVLAACGGGQRAGQSDSAAVATGAAPADTTAMAPTAAPRDSAMAAPTATTTPDTGAMSTSKAAKSTSKPTPTAKSTRKPTPMAKTPAAPDTSTPAPVQDTTRKAAAAQDTSKKAAAAQPSAGGNGTPQQIALGDSIFHGQVGGGTCSACHGQDAKGTAVAPDLTDSQWLNGDGSYQFIVNTITNGVPKPKQHPAPMPPKGGAPLTDDQVKAVAAYEYSLSHKS
ncbi:MAG TPA: c-type cytochrome [Gemmatimonadales bacterium]|nr:c-type cytochrome [Gemmatimonadales bacterium]